MAFTLVLILVSILGLVAGAALTALGVIAWGHRLGRHLPWQRPGTATAVGVAAVVVVLHLVGTIPVVGDLIVGFVVLSGLGAVSVTYLGFDDLQPAALPAETPDTASRSPATTSEPEPSVAAAARSTSVHRVRSSCARSSVLAR